MKVCIHSARGWDLYNKTEGGYVGGAEVNLYLLAKELAKRPGWEVRVLVSGTGQKHRWHRFGDVLVAPIRYGDHQVYHKPWHKVARRFFSFWQSFWVRAEIHIEACASELMLYTVMGARLRRKPSIFYVASDKDTDTTFLKKSDLMAKSYRLGLQLCRAIVAQTVYQKQQLKLNWNRDSSLINNIAQISSEPQRAVCSRTILWVGSCTPNKQPELFLELARQSSHRPFVMVLSQGERNQPLWESVSAEAAKLPNFTLLPTQPYEEMGKWFSEALAVVNTSIIEGYPNTFIQGGFAAAALLSLNADPDGMIEEFQLGTVGHGELNRLVDALSAENEEELRAAGERAYQVMMSRHDPSLVSERWAALILEVVKNA